MLMSGADFNWTKTKIPVGNKNRMMADHASGIGICVSKVFDNPSRIISDREMVNPPGIIEMGREVERYKLKVK